MKFTASFLLPLAGIASAIVIPDAHVFEDLEPQHRPLIDHHRLTEGPADKVAAWWDSLLDHLPTRESLLYAAGETVDFISHGIEHGKETIEHVLNDELQLFSSESENADDDDDGGDETERPGHGRPPHRRRPHTSDQTIYQLVQKCKYTTKFAKLIEDFPEVVKLLNSTDSGNVTLFVPTDKALARLPDHGDDDKRKPPKEVIEAALKYHIALGSWPAGRILHSHTIPTAYSESWLGDHPQRLRARAGLGGLRINFLSKVVAANLPAKNGIIHGIDHIILPPPMVGRIISLLPQRFSTLLHAYEKTNFVDFIHKVPMAGSTVFAPSNRAFARLGYKANAFLFNTDRGLKYLQAILKYHIVVNQTLYSDAFYDQDQQQEQENQRTNAVGGVKHEHIDLPTLLGDKSVSVDVTRWGGWIRLKVNGYVPVTVQDVPARNGVIQVVGRVLIPPHKHGRGGSGSGDDVFDGEIEVDELVERLRDYVEDETGDDQGGEDMGDL